MNNLNDVAHEIWAAAQLLPNEGIEDGVERIKQILSRPETEMTADNQKFRLYWLDGKAEVVEGRTPAEAMTLAGYSQGALGALDFYANVPSGVTEDIPYVFTNGKWTKK